MNRIFARGIVVALTIFVVSVNLAPLIRAEPARPAWRVDTPWSTETATVTFERDTVIAEIADTPELRSRGLGSRDDLPDGRGMLFVFEEPSIRTFWMKGMRFCIDIVWIKGDAVIGFEDNVCDEPGVSDADLKRYPSPDPVSLVLELPGGWMEEHNYGVGSTVTIEVPASVKMPDQS